MTKYGCVQRGPTNRLTWGEGEGTVQEEKKALFKDLLLYSDMYNHAQCVRANTNKYEYVACKYEYVTCNFFLPVLSLLQPSA